MLLFRAIFHNIKLLIILELTNKKKLFSIHDSLFSDLDSKVTFVFLFDKQLYLLYNNIVKIGVMMSDIAAEKRKKAAKNLMFFISVLIIYIICIVILKFWVLPWRRDVRRENCIEKILILKDVVNEFKKDYKRYPDYWTELVSKGYLKCIPRCPCTSNAYIYINEGESFRIECFNPRSHKGSSRKSRLKELYYDSEKGLVIVEKNNIK